MSALILLVGTSAAGKTTLGVALAATLPVTYVYATGEKLKLIDPEDPLNLFDQTRTYEINAAFFDGLPARAGFTIVDTQATYPYENGFVRLTPPSACARIAGIVLVEADADTIRSRRLERATESTDPATIARELVAERDEARHLSDAYGIPLCAVDGVGVDVAETVTRVRQFLAALPPP